MELRVDVEGGEVFARDLGRFARSRIPTFVRPIVRRREPTAARQVEPLVVATLDEEIDDLLEAERGLCSPYRVFDRLHRPRSHRFARRLRSERLLLFREWVDA